jgi:hypothetical protein
MYIDRKNTVVKNNASTPDIIDALLNAVPIATKQCIPEIDSMIYKSGDPLIDAESVCRYIRSNVKYKADGFDEQNIQLPGRMFQDTKQADCKSFSLAFVGMMKALGHDCGFRFASYRENKIPTHVYNFVVCNGKKYTFDACVQNLKESNKHTHIQDMKVQYLSAPFDYAAYANQLAAKGYSKQKIADLIKAEQGRQEKLQEFEGKPKTLFGKAARLFAKTQFVIPRQAFRLIVSFNARGLATQLDRAVQNNRSKVRQFWEFFGGKFDGGDSLMQSINTGKNKRPLFGAKDENRPIKGLGFYPGNSEDSYIGCDPTCIAAGIASATPIIVAAKDLFKASGIKVEDIKSLITPKEEADGEKLPDEFPKYDPNASIEFSPSPLMIGGILGGLALVYFLIKKKK